MGLGPQAKVAKPIVVQQVVQTQKLGTSGSAFFEYLSYFGGQYDVPLKQGVYREKAIVPFSNTGLSVKRILIEMDQKIDDIYVPMEGMENAAKYKRMLKVLINRLNENKTIDKRAAKMYKKIEEIATVLNNDATVNDHVKDRMISDIEYALQIIRIYNSKN